VAYLALFGSILAFSAYAWLLRQVRPAVATSYAYVNPPVAVLLGVWLGGETLGADSLAAMAVILAGVGLITLSRARLSRAAPR
jgi:drug/metabolite transporter (DMT)-like permease